MLTCFTVACASTSSCLGDGGKLFQYKSGLEPSEVPALNTRNGMEILSSYCPSALSIMETVSLEKRTNSFAVCIYVEKQSGLLVLCPYSVSFT